MPKYEVSVPFVGKWTCEIEAKSKEEAIEKAATHGDEDINMKQDSVDLWEQAYAYEIETGQPT